MANERVLSASETKRLRDLNLSPKVEKVVREIWEAGGENKKLNRFFSAFSFFFIPAVIALFVSSAIYTSIGSGLDNIATALVWIFLIFLSVIACFINGTILASEDRKVIFSHKSLGTWSRSSKWQRIYARFTLIVLLLVLAYCSHIFTAIVLFFIWIVGVLTGSAVREKVQRTIDQIEKE